MPGSSNSVVIGFMLATLIALQARKIARQHESRRFAAAPSLA